MSTYCLHENTTSVNFIPSGRVEYGECNTAPYSTVALHTFSMEQVYSCGIYMLNPTNKTCSICVCWTCMKNIYYVLQEPQACSPPGQVGDKFVYFFFLSAAINNLNGVILYGQKIHVTLSKHAQVQMPQAGSNVRSATKHLVFMM